MTEWTCVLPPGHPGPCKSSREEALERELAALAAAESVYRTTYEQRGDAHRTTGRAWDLLRRAGNNARALLGSKP